MDIEARIIPEPNLFFGENKSTIDPKVGLMNFGPNSPFQTQDSIPVSVSAGVVSTDDSLELLKDWLERLSLRIEGQDIPDSDVRGIDFPGLSNESPLRFVLIIDESNIETISTEELALEAVPQLPNIQ